MTAGRCKSTVYVCLIRPALVCPLRQLAKWGCPQFPAATEQRIRFRTFRLMLFSTERANDVPLLGERFSVSYCLEVIDPKAN